MCKADYDAGTALVKVDVGWCHSDCDRRHVERQVTLAREQAKRAEKQPRDEAGRLMKKTAEPTLVAAVERPVAEERRSSTTAPPFMLNINTATTDRFIVLHGLPSPQHT